jgi:hypothetical protein
MRSSPPLNACFAVALVALGMSVLPSIRTAAAADESGYRVVNGMAVYLGVVPAEVVRGHPRGHPEQAMHGGVPKGPHQYHVVVAIFDSASGARISNTAVTAQISGLGLAGTKQKLDPMVIANTITYGGFFNLPGRDVYTIRLTIEGSGAAPVRTVEFKYDHRR